MTEGPFATRVAQVERTTPRRLARALALDGLSAAARVVGRFRDLGSRPRVQHLYLHHVFEDEEDGFRGLVASLARDHRLISYPEALERIWSGRIDAPYVAFSFDDGLKSCLRAARVLEEFEVRACFFVVGGMVGAKEPGAVEKFCRASLLMPPSELLDWADLEALLEAGHEVGSHTVTHARLADLSGERVYEEIAGSRELLTRRLGTVRHFAWPYGGQSDVPPGVVEQALAAGYESCASAVRGAHATRVPAAELCLRRDHVMANWPVRHVRWFMARNAAVATKVAAREVTSEARR